MILYWATWSWEIMAGAAMKLEISMDTTSKATTDRNHDTEVFLDGSACTSTQIMIIGTFENLYLSDWAFVTMHYGLDLRMQHMIT